jgi:hypothetical protein
MSLENSRERGRPVLRISLYDATGRQLQSGLWMTDKAGAWQECSG